MVRGRDGDYRDVHLVVRGRDGDYRDVQLVVRWMRWRVHRCTVNC